MVLQNDPLIETLVFLTRLELLRMSIVNRRLRSIIADKFAYAPYLVLQYLQYDEHQDVFAHNYGWLWVDKNGARAICPASSRWQILANAKYVRVKFSQLSFCQNPMRIIQPISHFWKNMSMRIDLSYTYNATADFAQLVSTCQRLDLRCQGSLSVFGDIVSGTVERLSITYAGYDHSKHFPVSEVVSYLFTRNETNELRKRSLDINFHLGEQLTRSKSSHIVGEITKRFLASVTKARFSMKWRKECDNELSELHLYNDRINQTLKFVVKNSFVKISVK